VKRDQWIVLAVGICLVLGSCGTALYAAEDTKTPSGLIAAEGEKPSVVKELSLDDCINVALRNHGDVLVSEQSVVGAKARYTEAKSDYFPSISVQNTPISVSGGLATNNVTTKGTSISINQNIFDSGLRESNVKQALFTMKSNEAALLRQQQTTTFNVINAYYQALLTKHLAEVQEANVKYLEGQQELIHTRAEVGDAAQVDVLPVEAQLATAKVQQLAAKNAIRTALIDLQNVMGLHPSGDFTIRDIGASPKEVLDSLDKYQTLALTSRPDIAQNASTIKAAKAAEQSAKINLFPHLIVNGQYGNRLDKTTLQDWSITGGLAFNLFDGGKTRAVYQQTQAAVKSAEIQNAQLAKDIEKQVQEAYLNLTSAQESLDATVISLQASQKNYEAQEARYKEGLATPLDLLNAQLQVTTAQSDAVKARYAYYTAKAQLNYAIGKQGGLNGK